MEHIEILMGDWSCDGHGLTDQRTINSNLSEEEIKVAYKVATEKLGFNFCKKACAECECTSLTSQQVQALDDNGIVFDEKVDYDYVDNDVYFELYLKIIKLGNPNFVYTIEKLPCINIGGYGLFYL